MLRDEPTFDEDQFVLNDENLPQYGHGAATQPTSADGSTSKNGALTRWFISGAGGFFFLVLLLGQWAFFYYIAAFYGTSAVTGEFEVWNRLAVFGRTPYEEGDQIGNLAYLSHALAAGIIAFGGALQLVPQIRQYAPTFHRWNGRVFLFTVVGLSLSGFYLVWVRQTSPTFLDGLSTSFNGVLILTFAFLTARYAIARNIPIHRRWAMRLFLVSNAQWFLRVGLFGYFAINGLLGREIPAGDPFFKLWTFGCYLVPLAVLELYMRSKEGTNPLAHLFVGLFLAALTLVMGLGIFAFAQFSQAIITGAPIEF